MAATLSWVAVGIAAETARDPVDATGSGRPVAEEVVKLPPLVVEENAGSPWLVAKLEGTDVLSRCSASLTSLAVNRYQRLHAMLDLIYPETLQPRWDVPTVLLLDSKRPDDTNDTPFLLRNPTNGLTTTVTYLPNFHSWDHDSRAIHFQLEEFDLTRSSVTIAPAYIRYLLETRTPSLPRWFIEGMVTLQETVVMPVPALSQQITDVSRDAASTALPKYPYDAVTVLPFVWRTVATTREMHKAVKRAGRISGAPHLPADFPFLTLDRLLKTETLGELSPTEAQVFPYQAALFIRWALDPEPKELRPTGGPSSPRSTNSARFWQFVADAAKAPVTAERFRQAFDEPIDEVDGRLRGYLPFACLASAGFVIKPAASAELPDVAITEASPSEVSLLKGRLERLEARYADTQYPGLVPEIAQRARRTLSRIRGPEAAPYLAAELGLLEVDTGNDAAARPLLTAAAHSGVAHPRVYLELARIHSASLLKEHADLSRAAGEFATMELLLRLSLRQQPVLPGSFELLFETWLRRDKPLAPDQVALLDEAPLLFPRNFRIMYAATLLHIANGNIARGRLLLQQGLTTFPTGSEHARFVVLQEALDSIPTS